MKKVLVILAVILGLPCLLGASIFGYAATIDEFGYETRTRIDRPVQRVWDVLMDEEKAPEWLIGLESIENVSGEPLEVGSVWKLHFEMDGRPFDMLETVTACTPPTLYAFDIENDYFTGNTAIRLEAVEGGTDLVTTNTVAGTNALWRGVFYLQRDVIREQAEESYDRLKSLAEAEPR